MSAPAPLSPPPLYLGRDSDNQSRAWFDNGLSALRGGLAADRPPRRHGEGSLSRSRAGPAPAIIPGPDPAPEHSESRGGTPVAPSRSESCPGCSKPIRVDPGHSGPVRVTPSPLARRADVMKPPPRTKAAAAAAAASAAAAAAAAPGSSGAPPPGLDGPPPAVRVDLGAPRLCPINRMRVATRQSAQIAQWRSGLMRQDRRSARIDAARIPPGSRPQAPHPPRAAAAAAAGDPARVISGRWGGVRAQTGRNPAAPSATRARTWTPSAAGRGHRGRGHRPLPAGCGLSESALLRRPCDWALGARRLLCRGGAGLGPGSSPSLRPSSTLTATERRSGRNVLGPGGGRNRAGTGGPSAPARCDTIGLRRPPEHDCRGRAAPSRCRDGSIPVCSCPTIGAVWPESVRCGREI